jgi:hypothetical protein
MKSAFLILLFFLCSASYAQKESINSAKWHTSDKIDLSDYMQIKKKGLYWHVSNDNENIYLGLKVDGAEDQNLILQEGLIIWIDMNGKSEKKIGVRFPVGSQNQLNNNKAVQLAATTNPDGSPKSLISIANTIELIGFTEEEQRRFPSENPDNFTGSVRLDNNGNLTYKMKMPIAKLPVRNSKGGKGAMPFSLGIEYGFATEINKSGEKIINSSSSDNQPGKNRKADGTGRSSGVRNNRTGRSYTGNRMNSQEVNKPATGTEMYWIKDIRLATSK